MGWRTVLIENDENLRIYLNNLMILKENKKILIPLSDIDSIVIESYNATYSNKLLESLINRNINVIMCNYKHEPYMYMVPINGHHISLKVLQRQILWEQEYKSDLWVNIVKNKISTQKETLKKLQLDVDEEDFDYLIDGVKSFDISNREGHAAKSYWKTLFGKGFIRDYTAMKSAIINSMLNYGYAILRGQVIRSIIKKGLDPRISIFHKSATNFFALASDLMEPFRSLVDFVVYNNTNPVMDRNAKERIIEFLANAKIKVDNKSYFLNVAIDLYLDNLKEDKMLLWIDLWG